MKIFHCLPYCNSGQLLLSAAGVPEGYLLTSIGEKNAGRIFLPLFLCKSYNHKIGQEKIFFVNIQIITNSLLGKQST